MNNEAIEILKNGGVGIFPTDTAYGIGCRIDRGDSVDRIYSMRKRDSEKALLALVSSVEMAEEYVDISEEVYEKLIKKYWPGGLTIVLPCKIDKVPPSVRANGLTLAVRFPNHPQIIEIIKEVGVPIVAPSANYSGEPTPLELLEVDGTLKSQVDFVLEGVCTIKGVSTIIDCTVTPWKVIREGVVQLKGISE